MSDEQRTADERIAAAVRDLYNVPPETPREEMWASIEARLDAAEDDAADAAESGAAGTALPLRSRGSSRASHRATGRMAWWIGIAAALVIGLGIGRLSMNTGPAEVPMASGPAAETAAETTVAETPAARPEDGAAESADRTMAEAAPMNQLDEEARADAADRAVSAEAGTTEAPASDRPPPGAGDGAPPTTGVQYAATTRRLLDRGESLLATVRTDLASGAPDPEMETWARSLLSRTRVLMASPAAREPETRRLLEDLELMLAQIVVTTATGDPGEARILGEGLEDGDLLYRLRSATEENKGSPEGFRTPRTSSL